MLLVSSLDMRPQFPCVAGDVYVPKMSTCACHDRTGAVDVPLRVRLRGPSTYRGTGAADG
eukprot:7385764-Prymnesium_polylepis.2